MSIAQVIQLIFKDKGIKASDSKVRSEMQSLDTQPWPIRSRSRLGADKNGCADCSRNSNGANAGRATFTPTSSDDSLTHTRRVAELKSDANKEGNDTLEATQHQADSTDKVLGADSCSMNENAQMHHMEKNEPVICWCVWAAIAQQTVTNN